MVDRPGTCRVSPSGPGRSGRGGAYGGEAPRGSVDPGLVESLGELDDQAFGSADVAEEEHALVVDDLPDRVPAGRAHAVDDSAHIVDLERDVAKSGTVRRRGRLLSGVGG